jgi:hypothetical protein
MRREAVWPAGFGLSANHGESAFRRESQRSELMKFLRTSLLMTGLVLISLCASAQDTQGGKSNPGKTVPSQLSRAELALVLGIPAAQSTSSPDPRLRWLQWSPKKGLALAAGCSCSGTCSKEGCGNFECYNCASLDCLDCLGQGCSTYCG